MGNGGKWRERERARELRAQSWTLQAIADELCVAKGTVSVWVRDIERHEALSNRVVMKGHRHVLVAAGALKLRAA